MNTVFIHTNNKQRVGAIIAKQAILDTTKNKNSIQVEFINVDEIPAFKNFAGKEYLFGGRVRSYNPKDLQSFTISRFMAPQLMNFEGKAVVMDPDIFALSDISELFTFDMGGKAVACCKKKDAWDTSVMLLDCGKLKHWNIEEILKQLEKKELDYTELMSLKKEKSIKELPRVWNDLDTQTLETKMIHMTGRLTQPWKTGLPIDFTRNPMPKIFGIIPRELVHKILGKYDTHYKQHPNPEIEALFFKLAKRAYSEGSLTVDEIESEISSGYIRKDFKSIIGIN